MLRYIYSLLFYLLLPFILLRLIWRGFSTPDYWQRWPERFGFIKAKPVNQEVIWIHAVSVGEVQAAVPLIQALQQPWPPPSILVTTMTPTGSQRVQKLFGDKVWHVYLPYDLPDAVARFLNQVQPRLAIIMETELWPNLLSACHHRQIPVILANARLSANSAKNYQYLGKWMSTILSYITVIAAQTQVDAERFRHLGAKSTQVRVTGSIKFDSRLPSDLSEQITHLRQQWGQARLVWIAASTHEGEEEAVLAALAQLKPVFSNLLLVLVPRHPERFQRVARLCTRQGYKIVRRSENGICTVETDIYLGDTMGELPLLYAACAVAFVGGTLVPVGGHNLMEPAAVGVPIIVGPQVFEWAEITRQLIVAGAVRQVNNANELATELKLLLANQTLRDEMGRCGKLFVEQNRGALARLLEIIARI